MGPPLDMATINRVRTSLATGEARRLREEARISRAEVAAEVETTPATVWRWEAGNRVPRGEHAARYAVVLLKLREIVVSAREQSCTSQGRKDAGGNVA